MLNNICVVITIGMTSIVFAKIAKTDCKPIRKTNASEVFMTTVLGGCCLQANKHNNKANRPDVANRPISPPLFNKAITEDDSVRSIPVNLAHELKIIIINVKKTPTRVEFLNIYVPLTNL